ncbi:UNVERIFIED_ORG: putative DNA primase/helicase [Zoogloea ramigera]
MNTGKNCTTRRGLISLGDMLALSLVAETSLLGRMILEKSIGLIAGPRGGGKSWLAMIIAYSVAAGKMLHPWGIGIGAGVVLLDGEMRAASVQERFRLLHAFNSDAESQALAQKNVQIISRDFVGDPIGSIDNEEGQRRIDELIPDSAKLVIVDNLSAWTSGGREDSGSWALIKNWLIKKRLRGIAVLLIHHTGKNGQQRGSSMHEDLLDYSILLSPLQSNTERQDTRFGIEHTKLRDHLPELRQKYECSVWNEGESLHFEIVPAGFMPSQHEIEMLRMRDDGTSMEDIGLALGISKSTVSRTLKKLRERTSETES